MLIAFYRICAMLTEEYQFTGSPGGEMRQVLSTPRTFVSAVGVIALVFGLSVPAALGGAAPAAVAADASQFDPGYLVSDDNFYDRYALGGWDVQAFLDSRNACGTGSNCLAAYRQNTPTMPASKYCAPMAGQANESAASIIARVGTACGLSQKAIIVMLQKEQGLVTAKSPTKWALDHAMGHACPDTAPCDPSYAGFFYQVYYGARQFQVYRSDPFFNWYKANAWNNIRWSDRAECGSSPVFIRNQATAGLYFYTPYQPNRAALNNLYGLGDACSSYGNRNFWRLWSDWFGDPKVNSRSPLGVIKDMWSTEDGIAFWGWALDPDVPSAPVELKIAVGDSVTYWTADDYYPAVEAGAPGAGPNHGFGGTVPAAPGTSQTICVTMVNQGGGGDVSLGCRSIDLPPRVSPRGELKDIWTSVEGVHMWGWAIDPDALSRPVQLHVQVDQSWYVLTASAPYAPGPTLVQGAGPNHGFGGVLPVPAGDHAVCVTMVNANAGSNVPYGCRQLRVPSLADVSPKGQVQELTVDERGIALWGWAVDPDALSAHVPVVVQVDSQWLAWSAASPSAAAVSVFPAAGPNHGFGGTVALAPGVHWVCVYFMNASAGADVNTGCHEVFVPEPPPPDMSPTTKLMGAWASAGGITLWGYAFDVDALDSVTDVIVQVDSRWFLWKADAPYAPAADMNPGAGTRRGYVGEIAAAPGLHRVCTYAVNQRAGKDTAPECVQVRVP